MIYLAKGQTRVNGGGKIQEYIGITGKVRIPEPVPGPVPEPGGNLERRKKC